MADVKTFMKLIKAMESSGGKDTKHRTIDSGMHAGDAAIGDYGVMPNTVKEVADYLAPIMRYAQTGSLYEVVAEINRLVDEGTPPDLAPFITDQRLDLFKNKVITYLAGS